MGKQTREDKQCVQKHSRKFVNSYFANSYLREERYEWSEELHSYKMIKNLIWSWCQIWPYADSNCLCFSLLIMMLWGVLTWKWSLFLRHTHGAVYCSQSFKIISTKQFLIFFLQLQIIHTDFCKAPVLEDKPWCWNLQSWWLVETVWTAATGHLVAQSSATSSCLVTGVFPLSFHQEQGAGGQLSS